MPRPKNQDYWAKQHELEKTNKELLEALERSLNDFKNQSWTDKTYDLIESTIAKAKGGKL